MNALHFTSRWVHVVAGMLLGPFLYSPLGRQPWFLALFRYVLFPALLITGLLLWQQPRVAGWLRRIRGSKTLKHSLTPSWPAPPQS